MRLPTGHAPPRVFMVLAFAVAVTVLAACAGRSGVTRRSTPLPASNGDAVARNGACEGCHAEIANEWRASLHQHAHSDPVYQRAFAVEPLPFCTACHAPEANAEDPGPSPAHALGVGCVTCHTIASSHGVVRDARAPPTRTLSATRTAECASCHEFTFPQSSEKLQLTATEHRASRSADIACATCHMPRVAQGERAHASHRFDASRDPTFVRSAARVTATHLEQRVTFTFTPERVGHAFPTGDLFRRLRLVVELEGRTVEAFLGRKTKRAESGASVNAFDDRPFTRGEPAIVDVDIGAGVRPLAWRVLYERVEHPTTLDEREALVEGAIEVASGRF